MGFQQKSLFLLVAAALVGHSSASSDDIALMQNTLKNRKLPGLDVCGKSQVFKGNNKSGTPARLGEFPWMAAIGIKKEEGNSSTDWICSGSLITEQYVITAAHCIYPNVSQKDVTVRLGELDLNPALEDGAVFQDFEVESMTHHDDYDKEKSINDIGLIKLKTKVSFTDKISPICLALPEFLLNTYERNLTTVVGWGRFIIDGSNYHIFHRLIKVDVRIKNNAVCSQKYTSVDETNSYVIDQKVICASGRWKGTCTSDSGGPMMLYKNTPGTGNTYLMGTVSYGYKCDMRDAPAVYMRVSEYMQWIIEHLDI